MIFKMTNKKAFTLAEVLTTLLVIGVVAAITIPILISSYQERTLATASKKAQSVLSNAYKKMMADEGVDIKDLPIIQCNQNFSCLSDIHKKYFVVGNEQNRSHNNLPTKYLSSDTVDSSGNVTTVNKTEEASFSWDNAPYIFATSDGVTFGFVSDSGADTIDIVVDLNGIKAPNKLGKDLFKYRVNNQGTATDVSSELAAAGGCSVNDVSTCTTESDFQALWNSMNEYDMLTRSKVTSDGSCFVLCRTGSGGRLPAMLRGGNELGYFNFDNSMWRAYIYPPATSSYYCK